MDDEQFQQLVTEGIDAIPERFQKLLNNVAIVIADEPTADQRAEMQMHEHETLFGLYEGIPLTERGSDYGEVLPDKITIFKNPILAVSEDPDIIKREVAATVYHEIGHHFGLDEDEVYEREHKRFGN